VQPTLSVIIPTYNRHNSLRTVLRALGAQTYPRERYEVVVVDDGSTDGTSTIADHAHGFDLRYLRQANQGATAARNRGATEATGSILIFLDDDITVVPHFLEAMAQPHLKDDRVIVVGSLQPVERARCTMFERIYGVETSTPPARDRADIEPITFIDCLTGMLAVKNAHFTAVGRLHDVAGDGSVMWGDVEFGYRAYQRGCRFVRAHRAIGHHDDYSIRDLSTYSRRWRAASTSAVRLMHVHPELQTHLAMFQDKEPIAWQRDTFRLILRKSARQAMASGPALWVTETLARALESAHPSERLMRAIYRWIVGAYIYRGYREGLRLYGVVPVQR